MFQEPEAGIKVYIQELRDYNAWIKTKGPDIMLFDRGDYDRVRIWSAKLEGMVLALGLSKEEEDFIDDQVGRPFPQEAKNENNKRQSMDQINA